MFHSRNAKRRMGRRCGFTMAEVLVVTGILTGLGGGSYQGVMNKAHQVTCANNLKQLYMVFQMQDISGESLPRAWFYPPDPPHPNREQYNLVNIMARSGANRQLFRCPAAPIEIQQRGICYVYNSKLAGRELDLVSNPGQTWLLMDINIATTDVPAAHVGGYNVLYCDGHIKWIPASEAPSLITQAVDFRN